jgi:allophanate hydrolase subunit 1
MKNALELAKGLKTSNIKEVVEICEALLALKVSYDELHDDYVRVCAEKVMLMHEKTFKKLAESGD